MNDPDLVRAWAEVDQRCAATRQAWGMLRHNSDMRGQVVRAICDMQRDGIAEDDLTKRMVGCLAEYGAVRITEELGEEGDEDGTTE